MPNLEWKAVGEEPGCRQAAMDPQIKLFGQTISVIPTHTGAGADAGVLNPTSAYTAPTFSQDGGGSVVRGAENKGVGEKLVSARSSSGDEFSQLKFKVTEGGVAATGAQQLCEEQSEGGQSDERDNQSTQSLGSDGKSLQKPDKVVACPRCNSQDTKFCYYNNYNVNQPRHFCKNCQRYWTAGGTLRNVPVGAGRRKNKTGGTGGLQQQQQQQQRENSEASPSCSSFQMESGEFSCGLGSPKAKVSHPKRLAGQGSPLRSSSTSFGQESGITMSSQTYSLYQNGRLPFQAFNNSCSQGFPTSGAEVSGGGSSDSASMPRVGQTLVRFASGNGVFDKDCSRSSRSEPMQDAPYNACPRESSDTVVSGRVGNNNGGQPMRIFNGEWPHGYNLDWDGKHQHAVVSLGVTVLTGCNNTSAGPSATRSPAWVSTPWTSNVSHPQVRTGIPQSTLGKRQGDRLEACSLAKTLRAADVEPKSKWPMLQGRTTPSPPESGTLKQLFQHPKLEPSGASSELKDTFMSRLFNNAAAPRPVPFSVTI